MTKKTRRLLMLSWCYLFSCCTNNNFSQQKPVQISFIIDGKSQNISNDFKIYFVANKDTLQGSSDNNLLRLPDLSRDSCYDVIFNFKQYSLAFGGVSKRSLIPGQKFEWRFGIDNQPFDKTLGLLPDAEYNTDTTTRQLIYWQFEPMEHGDGIQIVKRRN